MSNLTLAEQNLTLAEQNTTRNLISLGNETLQKKFQNANQLILQTLVWTLGSRKIESESVKTNRYTKFKALIDKIISKTILSSLFHCD